MSKINTLIHKASGSSFYRWILNMVLARSIPFNSSHGFKVTSIKKGHVEVRLPFIRRNLNHIGGIHATALATLCEYTVGLTLITMLSEKEFRLILKSLRIEYFYQAKAAVQASFTFSEDDFNSVIKTGLQNSDALVHEFTIPVYDDTGNHICTGYINWQIKKWDKVKTK